MIFICDLLRIIADRLNNVDGYGLFIGGGVAYVVGQVISQTWPTYQLGVSRIGVVTFGAIFTILFFHARDGAYFSIVIRSIMFAVVVVGLLWSARPIVCLLDRLLVQPPLRIVDRWRARREAKRNAADQLQYTRELLIRQSEEAARKEVEAEHRRREDERRRIETDERARIEKANARRRALARADCERFYILHEAEIESRFSRALFVDYLKRHLGDEQPPEYVESQAEELKKLIEGQRLKTGSSHKLRTLGEIAAWFEEQKQQLELVSDEKLRRALIAQLKSKYAELSSQLMDEIG